VIFGYQSLAAQTSIANTMHASVEQNVNTLADKLAAQTQEMNIAQNVRFKFYIYFHLAHFCVSQNMIQSTQKSMIEHLHQMNIAQNVRSEPLFTVTLLICISRM